MNHGGRYSWYGSVKREEAPEPNIVASLKCPPNAKNRTEGENETRRHTSSILGATENTIFVPNVPGTVRGYRAGCGYGTVTGLTTSSVKGTSTRFLYLGILPCPILPWLRLFYGTVDRTRKAYKKGLLDLTDAESLCSKVPPVSYCTCIHASYRL